MARFGICLMLALVIPALGCVRQLVLETTGMRHVMDRRFTGWVDAGAPAADLDAALRRIRAPLHEAGPGSWTFELLHAARARTRAADAAAARGDEAAAARARREGAALYAVAKFPNLETRARREAYDRHVALYLEAAKAFDPPLEVARIPWDGAEIVGHLRIPSGAIPPVVVMTGGIDTFKGELDSIVDAMLAEGLAVFVFDMPGTGQSAWPLTADGDRIYSAAIDHLRQRPDLDGDRVAVYLRSFAGLFAVKLALLDPDVKAAVNVGGPIHGTFALDHIRQLPIAMVETVRAAMRLPCELSLEEVVAASASLSLQTQGLLHPPARQAPLLSINGADDELVPIDDLYLISRSGIQQEEWVYEGDGHVAMYTASENVPRAARWIRTQLDRAEPSR